MFTCWEARTSNQVVIVQEKAEGAGGAEHLLADPETGFISDKREDIVHSCASFITFGLITVRNVRQLHTRP